MIKSKLAKINEDKYLNRLVRQILNYLSENEIMPDTDISSIKKKLKTKQSNADTFVPTDQEIQETLSKLSADNRLVYLVSGIRKTEGQYLLSNLDKLMAQEKEGFVKITINFLRNTKNSYFCYLPRDIYEQLKISNLKSIESLN